MDVFRGLVAIVNGAALDYPICLDESRHGQVFTFYQHRAASGDVVPPKYEEMIQYFEDNPEETWYRDPRGAAEVDAYGDRVTLPSIDGFPYDPCEDIYLHTYLNREDVQQAIHAVAPANGWPGKISYAPDNLHANGTQPTCT